MKAPLWFFWPGLLFVAIPVAVRPSPWWIPVWVLVALVLGFWLRKRVVGTAEYLLSLLILVTMATPLISPYGPADQFPASGGFHLLGLDALGRDILSRVLYANLNSMLVAIAGSTLACGLGLGFGFLMTRKLPFFSALLDGFLQAFLSMPVIIYYLLGLSLLASGRMSLVLLFALTLWPENARMIQAKSEALRDADFVSAARMQGYSEKEIFIRELLPNLAPVMMVNFLVTLINAVLLESILSYLGLGLALGTPSLGHLIESGAKQLDRNPGILIVSAGLLLAWIVLLRLVLARFGSRQPPLKIQ